MSGEAGESWPKNFLQFNRIERREDFKSREPADDDIAYEIIPKGQGGWKEIVAGVFTVELVHCGCSREFRGTVTMSPSTRT